VPFVEPPHHDEPIDDRALFAADTESRGCEAHRLHVQIDKRRQPPIELQFGTARRLALLKRRKIEIRQPDSLFELVGPVACKEDPGHVAFHNGDLLRTRPIDFRAGKGIHQRRGV
jgi:hypothetical protein